MKTLLVRPGAEVLEKTLRGPWPEKLKHLEKLYKDYGILFRGFVARQALSSSGPLAVGTVLRELGEDVEFLDVPFEFGIPLTEKLNVERHEKIEEYIAGGGYDIVGISCTGSFEGVATKRIAEAAKRVGNLTVVVGGYQATAEALDMLKKIPAVDVIVLGDFEPVAEQLYAALNGEIPTEDVPNVFYRENGTIHVSERKYLKLSSEDLPIYDYSLVEKYIPKYAVYYLEASRGCLYNCSFCQESVVRQSYTLKEASAAVDEIIDVTNYIGQFVEPVFFGYSDPLWGANRKWVKDFCSELADRRDEITADRFGWGIEGRVGQFNDETLSLMKNAGCITVGYGVESLSPRMLRMMNKTKDPRKYVTSVFDTVGKTLRGGLHPVLMFILGLPGETSSTIKETLKITKRIPTENQNIHMEFGLAYPYRGTELDRQIHNPQFTGKHGIRILDENGWEKAYIPRYTQLFDPSRELSASGVVALFLDIIRGTESAPASLEKRLEMYKGIKAILDKDGISPEDMAKGGEIYRKIVTKVLERNRKTPS